MFKKHIQYKWRDRNYAKIYRWVGWIGGFMDGCMDGWMDRRINEYIMNNERDGFIR